MADRARQAKTGGRGAWKFSKGCPLLAATYHNSALVFRRRRGAVTTLRASLYARLVGRTAAPRMAAESVQVRGLIHLTTAWELGSSSSTCALVA